MSLHYLKVKVIWAY